MQQSSLGKLTQLRTKHFPACISIASQREAIQGQFDDTDGIWSLWQYAHSLFDIARGHNKVNWNPKRDKLCSLVRQEFEPCVSGSILQQNECPLSCMRPGSNCNDLNWTLNCILFHFKCVWTQDNADKTQISCDYFRAQSGNWTLNRQTKVTSPDTSLRLPLKRAALIWGSKRHYNWKLLEMNRSDI